MVLSLQQNGRGWKVPRRIEWEHLVRYQVHRHQDPGRLLLEWLVLDVVALQVTTEAQQTVEFDPRMSMVRLEAALPVAVDCQVQMR